MKKAIYLLLSILIFSACKPDKYKNLDDGLYAEIQTNKGDILLELYPEDVPMTVANFTSLADGTNTRLLDSLKGKNFYEGIIFHRVVNNFVIQGGGFTPEGRKNPGFVFGDEFTKNEDGSLKYKHDDVGVLSMANGGPGSNNSQFFITHRPIPHLDNRHSVFGKTIVSKEQLAILQTANKDTLQLKKAIDSTRMAVVSKIVQGDTINAVNIIKIGSKANSFDATTIFDRELEKLSVSEKERKAAETKADEARYSQYLVDKANFLVKMEEPKATKTASGLRILMLKKNASGKKINPNKSAEMHYTIYVADGKKIQSTAESKRPLKFTLNDPNRPMIAGFKEGVLTMREGEKARLFIPYYIGYGENAYGPFPKKADLVFEVELLSVEK